MASRLVIKNIAFILQSKFCSNDKAVVMLEAGMGSSPVDIMLHSTYFPNDVTEVHSHCTIHNLTSGIFKSLEDKEKAVECLLDIEWRH